MNEYSGKLPRPDRILVYDFAVSPDEVKLDTGLSAEIAKELGQFFVAQEWIPASAVK